MVLKSITTRGKARTGFHVTAKRSEGKPLFFTVTNIRAQATTELALFGTIMLVIFAALMRYAIVFNAQQSAEMFAFRKACKVAKDRHSGWGLFDMQYSAANVNVQKRVYPPNVFASQSAQESETVNAGASVTCEPQGALFMPEVEPDDLFLFQSFSMKPDNRYYLIGPNNEPLSLFTPFFRPGLMLTVRSANDKLPRSGVDGIMDMLNGKLKGGKFVFSWEPVPYRDQEQNTTIVHDSAYRTQEQRDSSTYAEQSTTTTTTNTRYIGPDFANLITMILEDPDMLFALPVSKDMTIDETETVTQDRSWGASN